MNGALWDEVSPQFGIEAVADLSLTAL